MAVGKSLGPDGLTMPSPAPAAALDRYDETDVDATPTISRKRQSEQWEVLSESGASLISPKQPQGEMVKSDSMRSWKSAENGGALGDFGGKLLPFARDQTSG